MLFFILWPFICAFLAVPKKSVASINVKPLRDAAQPVYFPIDASVSITAVGGRPEIVMETVDESVIFLEANATSKDDSVVNGDVSAGKRVNVRALVGGTHYLIHAKLSQNRQNIVRSYETMTYPFPPVDISTSENMTTTESIMLGWSTPFNTRIQGYQILYQGYDVGGIPAPLDLKMINVSNAVATSFNVTGLEPSKTYSFRMRSFVENVSSVETPASLYCTRPLQPSFTVEPLPGKLMLQLQRPSNSTKYFRVKLLNLDVKDHPVREIIILSDSMVVNRSIDIEYEGATYEVRVAAVACDLFSEEVSQIVHSLPPAVTFYWPPVGCTPTSIRFVVSDDWKFKRGLFTRFVFATQGIPPKYILPKDYDRRVVELTGLIPGTIHEILGWTEQGDVQSEKRSMTVQLKPNNVVVLHVTNTTSNGINFSWEPRVGLLEDYSFGHNQPFGKEVQAHPGSCFPVRHTK
ncbi:tyrosine-protein phosphatase 10D-like isoform X2 [Paramacrobiotus metropolitanus]|uniref:tyrosine-protein phosphatase 10D-like isoform X2 n=1 Tax=Paramacrobiotus metropolitanus TaxID=2943436 RepID=UPI002445D04A|nr:tyrosine-protein phosphatase 10D-like isoform X2 [Paramacrobiotus metropolitanus]